LGSPCSVLATTDESASGNTVESPASEWLFDILLCYDVRGVVLGSNWVILYGVKREG